MGDRVELAFRRAALRTLPATGAIGVAVSGGSDSVALLELLRRFGPRRGLRLTVLHLDHALRRGSAADARFVARLARAAELPAVVERRPVEPERRRDESLEESARRVRRGFLLEAVERLGLDAVATGHTLDDQAETVLMRLVRGAGPTALCGMAPRGPGPFARPLLGIERADLRAWLERRGVGFREDPSNRDLRFDRNRVRHLVVPLLSRAMNPAAARNLVAAAERLRRDAEYLDGLALRTLDDVARAGARGGLVLDGRALAALDPALGGRVAREALVRAGADPRRVGARHIEALLRLAGGDGSSLDLPGRLRASRRGPRVTLGPRPG